MLTSALELRIFFPASQFDFENLSRGLQKFRELGFFVEAVPEIPQPHRFYCATRPERFASLQKAVQSPGPAILVAARGGYGCVELLEKSDVGDWDWNGKSVLGFSDLTALHAYLSNKNIPSFHGPMAASGDWLGASEEEIQSLCGALNGYAPALKVSGTRYNKAASSFCPRGRLVGGNLTVLASLMGTPWQLQLRQGDFLFLEDIGETEYRLARCLFQLSHCANFNSCHIIWGHLTQCGALASEQPEKFISQLMEDLPNSWSYGLQAGHERPNFTLPLGQIAQLSGNSLSFSERPFRQP